MPDSVRITCSKCGRSIYTVDPPIVVRLVVGAHPDAGAVEVTEKALPPVIREVLQQPVSRFDFCLDCFTDTLGPAFTAEEPPKPPPPTEEEIMALCARMEAAQNELARARERVEEARSRNYHDDDDSD